MKKLSLNHLYPKLMKLLTQFQLFQINGGKIVIGVSSKGKSLEFKLVKIQNILKTVGSGKRGLRYVLTQKMTQKLNEKI